MYQKMINEEWRYYGFVNHIYMSSKQYGIQSVHVLGEITNKLFFYDNDTENCNKAYYEEWVKHWKTCILLQGGNQQALKHIEFLFKQLETVYPCASFREDMESLNGCLTACGIILPYRIFGLAETLRKNKTELDHAAIYLFEQDYKTPYTEFELELIMLLKHSKLA